MTPDPYADLARAQQFWRVAADYPATKELYYPEHAHAHGMHRHSGQHVLEYGCGGGSDALSWARRGNRVTATDIVRENVARTAQRAVDAGVAATCTPLLLSASAPLPFPDGAFDVVSSHGVLHHIRDPLPVLAEFRRVLVPGGWCYIMLYTDVLRAAFDTRIPSLVAAGMTPEEAFGACTDGAGCPYARAYTEDEGRALLEAAGFVVPTVVTYNTHYFRTYWGRSSLV